MVADVVGKRCNRSHGILDLRRATIDGARHLNRARGRLSGGKFLALIIDQEGLIIALYKRHGLVLGHVDGQGRREIAGDCHRIDPVQSSNTGSCLARVNAQQILALRNPGGFLHLCGIELVDTFHLKIAYLQHWNCPHHGGRYDGHGDNCGDDPSDELCGYAH